ncbi:DNA oxidative demethylase ALKBH2 isoform X2 [Pelobates fuscus]|uniref:DNA oxidative demethylase ALKBH2 isoform X2 n=1 Tax=Pelobates fuscus TaxID=191477 RepID=UPI002FE44B89
MDRFLIKNSSTRKRPLLAECTDTVTLPEKAKLRKNEDDRLLAEHLTWKEIRAEGLSCDYTLLYTKTEADVIFQQLEREITYFPEDLSRVQVYGKWHNVPRKQTDTHEITTIFLL